MDIIVMAIITVIVVVFLLLIPNDNVFLAFNASNLKKFDEGWKMSDGGDIAPNDLSDIARENGSSSGVTIVNTLPADLDRNDSLNFRSRNVDYKIYIDGELIKEFDPYIPRIAGKSYGSAFHHITLPEDAAGKEIRIETVFLYEDGHCYLDMIFLGDGGDYYHWLITSRLPSFLLSIIIIIFGLIMFIASFLVKEKSSERSMFYLGLLGIVVGFFTLSDTLFMQLMWGGTLFWHCIAYFGQMLLVYPGFCYVNSIMLRPEKMYDRIVFVITMLQTVVCFTATALGIADYHSLLILVHIYQVVIVTAIVVFLVRDALTYKRLKTRNPNSLVYLAFIIFLVTAAIDMVSYDLSVGSQSADNNRIMRVGITIFILSLSVRSIKTFLIKMKLANESAVLSKIAYSDPLTGIGNRAAFIRQEEAYEVDIKEGDIKGVLVGMFDLNGLKQVNDNLGHSAGDAFIQGAAEVIKSSFGPDCGWYRTGGDEFIVLMAGTMDETEEKYQNALKAMGSAEEAFNATSGLGVPLYIAHGHAYAGTENGMSVVEAERIADSRMYEDKKRSKSARKS